MIYSYIVHFRNGSGCIGIKDKYTPSVTLNLNRGEKYQYITDHIYKNNKYSNRQPFHGSGAYKVEPQDLRGERYKANMAEMNFLGTPAFYPPKEFTGKAEHFEEFSYKLRAYMNLINPGYNHIFRMVE